MILVLPFTTKMGYAFAKLRRWLRYHYQRCNRSIWTYGRALYQGILRKQLQSLERRRYHDLPAWKSLLWRGWVSLPKHASQGQSSLSNQPGLSGPYSNQSSWLLVIWVCIEKIPPCQRFWTRKAGKNASFSQNNYTDKLTRRGLWWLPKYVEDILEEEEGKKWVVLLVIGCGGVAQVAISKICQDSETFTGDYDC